MSERPLTNPPTCTCQYLTVGNRLTTHNAVDSSRCEVHGPLSALRPPTPSAMVLIERKVLQDLVDLSEMDNEASQPGTDLYLTLHFAREALDRPMGHPQTTEKK